MSDLSLALMDKGETNRRILSKDEYRADFRRVEAASLKRTTHLASAEGKRIFARCFYSFQASMYFVSALGRTKLPHEYIEQVEQAVRAKIEEATTEINRAIDGAALLFKNHSIECVATYDTPPLELEIGITSAIGRRYFELIHKLDQLMPLLQTLEIEEVISERQVEQQRSRMKRVVLAMSSSARNLSVGCRRRMNDVDSSRAAAEPRRANAGASKATPELPDESRLAPEGDQPEPATESDAEPPSADAIESAEATSVLLATGESDAVETPAVAVEAQL